MRAIEVPCELQELGARIERLRERLKHGDADMAADGIQAAIDGAEARHRQPEEQVPAKPSPDHPRACRPTRVSSGRATASRSRGQAAATRIRACRFVEHPRGRAETSVAAGPVTLFMIPGS
jgi:hypothetical protein